LLRLLLAVAPFELSVCELIVTLLVPLLLPLLPLLHLHGEWRKGAWVKPNI